MNGGTKVGVWYRGGMPRAWHWLLQPFRARAILARRCGSGAIDHADIRSCRSSAEAAWVAAAESFVDRERERRAAWVASGRFGLALVDAASRGALIHARVECAGVRHRWVLLFYAPQPRGERAPPPVRS